MIHALYWLASTQYGTTNEQMHSEEHPVLGILRSTQHSSVLHSAYEKSKASKCWFDAIENLLKLSKKHTSINSSCSPIFCSIIGPASDFQHHKASTPEIIRQNLSLAFTNCQLKEDGLETYPTLNELVAAQSMSNLSKVSVLDVERASSAKMTYGIYTQYRLHILSLCSILEDQGRGLIMNESVNNLIDFSLDLSGNIRECLVGFKKLQSAHDQLLASCEAIGEKMNMQMQDRFSDSDTLAKQLSAIQSSMHETFAEIQEASQKNKPALTALEHSLAKSVEDSSKFNALLHIGGNYLEEIINISQDTKSAMLSLFKVSNASLSLQSETLERTHSIADANIIITKSFDGFLRAMSILSEKQQYLSDIFKGTSKNLTDFDHQITRVMAHQLSMIDRIQYNLRDTTDQLQHHKDGFAQMQSYFIHGLDSINHFQHIYEVYSSKIFEIFSVFKLLVLLKLVTLFTPFSWSQELFYASLIGKWIASSTHHHEIFGNLCSKNPSFLLITSVLGLLVVTCVHFYSMNSREGSSSAFCCHNKRQLKEPFLGRIGVLLGKLFSNNSMGKCRMFECMMENWRAQLFKGSKATVLPVDADNLWAKSTSSIKNNEKRSYIIAKESIVSPEPYRSAHFNLNLSK